MRTLIDEPRVIKACGEVKATSSELDKFRLAKSKQQKDRRFRLVTAARLITRGRQEQCKKIAAEGFCGQDRDKRRTAMSRCVSLGCYICVDEFE
jgi:hypothetical protein